MADRFIPDWLQQRAQLTPHRLAIVADGQRWTFAELDRRVDGAAEALRQQGVLAGHRVGVNAQNGAGFVLAVHALARLGAVLVPINTRLMHSEVDWQVHDAEVSLVLGDTAVGTLMDYPNGPRTPSEFELEAPHSIVYTSGTSGRPKGAILTFGNHWWSAIGSVLNLGLVPEDRWLACLPLFHVGGLSILLRSVVYGIAAVVHTRFDPAAVNRAIDNEGVTSVSVVATMLDRMLAERGERAYPATLRCVLLGGGPAPIGLLRRAVQTGAPVVQTYGLTETASQVVTIAPDDAIRKLGAAGKPLMGTQIRIEPDGEISIMGPTVSPGYLHQPPRTGWFHTGDLGYLDEDGFLYVLDRRDDLIVSGGENVYPAEVEAALLAHPAIDDAGVFGVEDADWGRSVAAAIVVRPGANLSVDNLAHFCRERLAGYKVPRQFVFRESLPRNAAGKLVRRELRIER
jgi:o-succinylbenzoate---CoA ligase